MNDGNKPDVNLGLQLTPEMVEFLAKKKAEDEKATAEKARQKEIEDKRKATLESLESQGVLKTLEAGGIRDVLKSKPELLDSPAALETALEFAKLKIQTATPNNSQSKQNGANDNSNPDNPNGGNGETKIPEYGTPDFFAALSTGKLTEADIDKIEKIRPEDKELLKMSIPQVNPTKEFGKFFN